MNFYYRDLQDLQDSASADAATVRLRTDQMLRAVRVAHGLGGGAKTAEAPSQSVTGEVLSADDPAGTGARLIESGAAAWADTAGAGMKSRFGGRR